MRISALLEAVSLSQPALSRLVSRLAERDLLARSEPRGDGRTTLVCLTETGDALIDRAMAIHTWTVHETLTSKFSDREQAAFLRLLSRVCP
ncbi:MAG TPA: MarR family transcriptional regulator [Thermomicrobiales bacterium]|nr:MarR family transcriptional regulator [Thermomicrobiales bacterium]